MATTGQEVDGLDFDEHCINSKPTPPCSMRVFAVLRFQALLSEALTSCFNVLDLEAACFSGMWLVDGGVPASLQGMSPDPWVFQQI